MIKSVFINGDNRRKGIIYDSLIFFFSIFFFFFFLERFLVEQKKLVTFFPCGWNIQGEEPLKKYLVSRATVV